MRDDIGGVDTGARGTWAGGDYARVGNRWLLVSELLCETAGIRPGERVIDVATGTGNTALAAARRFADVTGVDYVPALLEHARARAAGFWATAFFALWIVAVFALAMPPARLEAAAIGEFALAAVVVGFLQTRLRDDDRGLLFAVVLQVILLVAWAAAMPV